MKSADIAKTSLNLKKKNQKLIKQKAKCTSAGTGGGGGGGCRLILYLIRFNTNNKLHFLNNDDIKEF